MLVVALIVTIYTAMGGLWADTLLDFMQMFLTAGGITLIFLGVLSAVGGCNGLMTNAGSFYVSNAVHAAADRRREATWVTPGISAYFTGWLPGWPSDLAAFRPRT